MALRFDIAELAMQRDGLSANVDFASEVSPEHIEIRCQCHQIPDMSAQDHFYAFALVFCRTKNRQSDRQGSFDAEVANDPDFDGSEICTIDADRHKGLLHE